MKKIFLLISILFIISLSQSIIFSANQIPGVQDNYIGYGAKELSLGYTGISELGSIDGNSFNPASQADARRMANSLMMGGFGSRNFLLSAGFVYPTDFAVLSINGLYMGDSFSNALASLLGVQINAAKPITENLFLGISLKYFSGASTSSSDWQFGGDLGIILKGEQGGQGFGFFDPSYGLVLKNLGKNIQLNSYDPFPAMGIGAGASFYPIKFDFYQMRLSGDLVVPFNPFNFVLNVGMENILFDFIKIRAGYALNTQTIGVTSIGPLLCGIAFAGKIGYDATNTNAVQFKTASGKLDNSTDVEISYSLQMQNFNGVNELAHFVNVSVAWGYYDTQKPDAQIQPDVTYFSPNYDGIQDEVHLNLNIKDNKMVDGWEVQILDKNNKLVKTFKSMDKPQLRTLTVEKLLTQIFSSKQQVEIPKEVVWNGQDENGVKMPDGEYTYVLRAWDENNNIAETQPGKIIIDTVVPKIEPVLTNIIFSPNNDGSKDELVINIKSSDIQTGDIIQAFILDTKSNVVRSYEYKDSAPGQIIWDGRDNQTNLAPEGEYSFYIIALDKAGNRTERTISDIQLVTNYQKVTIDSSDAAFSPNNDGIKDTVTFHQKASDSKGLEKWSLKIYDASSDVVKEFNGEKNLPEEIVWDGRDKKNAVLPDGIYSYDLQLIFDSGNHPITERKSVRIDTTPPAIVIKPEYLSFSPNNDGKQDTITFYNTIEGDDDDNLEIKIIDSSGNAVYYNSYKKKDFPKEFVWNGLDKDLKPLPEGKYTYLVEGTDSVGNKNSKKIANILLKTGLEKVTVQSDVFAFSPKSNDVNKVVFTPTVTSKDGITEFTFTIRDDKNNTVRTYKTNQYINRIEWEGKDNYRNSVRDGLYSYQLKVKYNYGDEPVSAVKYVKVDTKAPEITLKADDSIFSPNGDGNKETFIIHQTNLGEPGDLYEAKIMDPSGKAVKSFKWPGTIPPELVWDGLDDKGSPVDEGIYKYEISGIDSADNRTVKTIDRIKLVRSFERLIFTSDIKAFSPNGDGILDVVKFNQTLSSREDLIESALTVYDSTGNGIRRFTNKTNLENEIAWDGKNDSGIIQPDGYYLAEMKCRFASGNLIGSVISNILLDRTPPAYKLTISPDLFTPDNDGENDVLFINLELNDMAGIKNWEMNIYKKLDNGAYGRLFKKFSGSKDTKQLIQWDGYSDDKQDLVEAVQDYILELKAEDNVGNKLTNVIREIPVGVLVEKTPEGLRIRVSSIQFDFDKADLAGSGPKNLDKVIYIIRKILSDPKKYGITENYRIEIGGHTDDIGTDEYNEKLSQKRAYTVYNYLVEKDVDPKILTYVGYGKSRPYKIITADMSKEKKEDYRARNRRVEFFIRK